MKSVNMSDTTEVMHAAMRTYEENQRVSKLPKKKPAPKKTEPQYNEMWNNLAYMDDQQKRIDKDAKKFVGDYVLPQDEVNKLEAERKARKIKEVAKESETALDTNFDEDSLSVYGATLQEQVSEGKDAEFKTDEKMQKIADAKAQLELVKKLTQKDK